MQIRLAKGADYGQLLVLLKQLNPDDPTPGAIEFGVFEEIIASKNLQLILAEDAGNLLGSCYLNLIPNLTRGGRPYALIENVITDSRHRNRGIGRALMDRALELARDANCYKVMLMSGRKHDAVRAFYTGCGFDPDAKQAYIRRVP
jgi:GNAT superfamily N-acetyltransferase